MSAWFAISGCKNEGKVSVNVTENHILAASRPNLLVGRRKVKSNLSVLDRRIFDHKMLMYCVEL
jgi:hypothetical protein